MSEESSTHNIHNSSQLYVWLLFCHFFVVAWFSSMDSDRAKSSENDQLKEARQKIDPYISKFEKSADITQSR